MQKERIKTAVAAIVAVALGLGFLWIVSKSSTHGVMQDQPTQSTNASAISAQDNPNVLQFRGLRAGLSKAEVSALMNNPGDKLQCKPMTGGVDEDCKCDTEYPRCRFGNATGGLVFSTSNALVSFNLRTYERLGSNAGQQVHDEMTARLGQGENVAVDDYDGRIPLLAGWRKVVWKEGKTVPCLIDPKNDCPSQELTLDYNDDIATIEFNDWGYYAKSEGLKKPDPNAPHPTVDGTFELFGLGGGMQESDPSSVLGQPFSEQNCHTNVEKMTSECSVISDDTRIELTFYKNKLEFFRYHFPASEWQDKVKFFKASLHGEPTNTDNRTSSNSMGWESTATSPCYTNPEGACPDEAFCVIRKKGEREVLAFYVYVPVEIEDMRDSLARAHAKWH